jgi:serine/threonine protein kinase
MERLSKIENYFINLIEVFEGEQTYYLVLQLMEGKTLSDELELLKVLVPIKNNFQSKKTKRCLSQALSRRSCLNCLVDAIKCMIISSSIGI